MTEQRRQKVVVIGAGPVGALAALYAANRGDDVEIYELRGDPRLDTSTPLNFTKSINLALSERGINGLRHSGHPTLLDDVLAETIPMHGRMIHGRAKDGTLYEQSQLYDVRGRFIRAMDRASLNKRLLDELEKMPNVEFYFNHKLTGVDFNRNLAWIETRDKPKQNNAQRHPEVEIKFDFMIGADGAHSAARFHLMKFARMSYQQEYIDTLWCEFHMDAKTTANGTEDFKIHPNRLHIWPAGDFMFIAIPSNDKTFTCTLFMPHKHFARLDADHASIVPFFEQYFPGIADELISRDNLQKQYLENPHLPLISIKCSPHHYGSSGVIVGDASHAMVPFYGQGMNTGLEDVRVLFEGLDKHKPTSEDAASVAAARARGLEEYSELRVPDAAAITNLALNNYKEMRSDVLSPIYKLRKAIEEKLSVWFPSSGWATQYSRVSFGNERYSEVERKTQHQGRVLERAMLATLLGTLGMLGVVLGRLLRNDRFLIALRSIAQKTGLRR